MKRKVTDLEQKLINDGWCLTTKRYTGKHSEKTHCYEYHKTSDITNNGKSYEQVIQLDQKRSQIVNYGIANIQIDYLDREELDLIRFLFLELRHFVERTEKEFFYSTEIDPPRIVVKDISEEDKQKMLNSLNEPGKVVVVPNSELDEKQELPPMTPEQFDEMCQEMENENAKGS